MRINSRTKGTQMFGVISFSAQDLRQLLAEEISRAFTQPITADTAINLIHETDAEGNLKQIIVEIEIPTTPTA
ncbi:MAG: hypothetical protein HC781_20700 [Leptolyngbyaceae cyanobacterium CSU_1_4]|nr:hypothetical protein [Leptolyngbyaceae cyanobacterium CSU_1_4]